MIHFQAVIQGVDERFRGMLASLHAIMFFATPHQGGNGADLGLLFVDLLKAVNVDARGDLLKQLQVDSTSLFDLNNDFSNGISSVWEHQYIYTPCMKKRRPR